jgi:hypothetical protein
MPKFRSFAPRTSWQTRGETASIKNACSIFGLDEADISFADPPIECQWRRSFGNSYAVVRLADVAALKKRLEKKRAEDELKEVIEEMGEENYQKMLADEKRKTVVVKLREELEFALKAGQVHGIADTLDGLTVAKTKAKTEWWVADVDDLTPIDPSQKSKKYKLSDVIDKASRVNGSGDKSLASRMAKCKHPDRHKFYSRYLLNKFEEACETHDDSSSIRKEVVSGARANLAKTVAQKRAELAAAQQTLSAFDAMAGGPSSTPSASSLASGALVTPATNKKRKRS